MRVDESGVSVLTEEPVGATAIEQCWHYVRGRRRTLLVDRPYQLRVSLFNLMFMTLLLIPILASYYVTLTAETSASVVAPELQAYFAAQDMAQFRLVLAAACVFLLGSFLITIFETHRTAGAAFAVKRQLESIRKGGLNAKLKLRREDNLVGIEGAFNEMVDGLRERSRSEIAELETLADDLDRSGNSGNARETAARLRLLAERKRGTPV